MPDRELKLNSLSRYSKQSPLFILEEHGHCEVPAGCGGVVLRWRDPQAGIPVSLWLHSSGTVSTYLDGSPLSSGRPVIPFGVHVLAFVLDDVNPAYAAVRFAATYGHLPVPPDARSMAAMVRSATDGTWRYTTVEPDDDGWMRPGFDDSGWSSMVERQDAPEEDKSRHSYRLARLVEFGAQPLGIDSGGGPTWLRKAFTIYPPGTTE